MIAPTESAETTNTNERSSTTFDLVTDWLQIATGFVVIAGMGLVIWELEQARQLTQAQLTSEGWARLSERNLAIIGDGGAQALAKACERPDELTSEELRVMNAITQDQLNALARILALSKDADLYSEDDSDWTRFSDRMFATVFSTQFGRDWWSLMRESYEPEIVQLGDGFLAGLGEPNCLEAYEGLRPK